MAYSYPNKDMCIGLYIVGHAVAQFVEALHYKPEGHGFDSRWCHWDSSLT